MTRDDIIQKNEISKPKQKVCECSLRTRLVGDGCEICNPELADELAKQNEQDIGGV